jgi:tetratricopeptide (TPR) repeat protein
MRTALTSSVMGAALAIALSTAAAAQTRPLTPSPEDAVRLEAYDLAYNLDYDRAVALLREAASRSPGSATLHRSLATMTWLQILFARGSVTLDDYLGPMSKQHVAFKPPPPALASRFLADVDRATNLAERRLASSPGDLDALYELGAAVGLRGSYIATVEGRMLAAVRTTLRAYRAHEQVLAADPRRVEAGLLVGTYQYIVANLTWPLRWMARVVGFRASRERGLALLEQAAGPTSDAQVEAWFGLLIIYTRERRFDEADRVVRELMRRFPRNRLLWLNAATLALAGGRPADAQRDVDEGFAKLTADPRPRVEGEEALWHYKRGAVRVAVRRTAEAESDLRAALRLKGRSWVHGRAHTELARLAILRGEPATARGELRLAVQLCNSDNDPVGAAEAMSLSKTVRD